MSTGPDDLYTRLEEARRTITERAPGHTPRVALILGSGLGAFADRLEDAVRVDYQDIPHFPVSSVQGHAGRLVLGHLEGVPCITMQGRVH